MTPKYRWIVWLATFCLLLFHRGNSALGKLEQLSFEKDSHKNDVGSITHHKRRFWIDELSDCIDMYCKKYVATDAYVNCMLINCPEGILQTSNKRANVDTKGLTRRAQKSEAKHPRVEATNEMFGSFAEPYDVRDKMAAEDPLFGKMKSQKKFRSTN